MANYKELEGFSVQTLATDPDNPGWVGSIFYNSTEGVFKTVKPGGASAGTWASGGNLNTSRYQISGDGSATAAIVAGGDVYPSSPRDSAITEIYNGTSWTEVNDLNNPAQTSRNFGTVTASIAVNNYPTVNTEIWNGTSWSNSPTTLNTARTQGSGTGISTAGLYSGGVAPGPSSLTNNETWNGTSWTEVGDLNTGRKTEGSGSQTSAIVVGGIPPTTGATESWDGTSWTEVADLNTARAENGVAAENNSSAITWCGDIVGVARVSNVEYYDGTSWTEVADYPVSLLRYPGNAGSSSAALGFGGINDDASPTTTTSTNEWTVTPPASFQQENLGQVFYNSTSDAFKVTQQSMPAGTWSSGGALNTARGVGGSMGTQTAALVTGGLDPLASPGVYGQTESYNGSAWTEVADLNTPRRSNTGTGTQTAAITSGQISAGGETESWNGSAWASVNSLNTARGNSHTFFAGTQTASLHISGQSGPSTTFTANVESWDGTNWTEIANVNTARRLFGAAGTQTDALIAGSTVNTEIWNGSTWTEVNNLNTPRIGGGGCGTTNTAALVFGGETPAPAKTGNTESWDGTSWTEVADLATARSNTFSAGTSRTALAAGAEPASTTATEEWNVPTANYTLTAS